MRRVFACAALLLAACGAQIGGSTNGPDAGGGDDDDALVDAPEVIDPDMAAAPRCANGRTVYLNFDGVALTRGTSDAKLNRASWMQDPTAQIPRWNTTSANRANDIATVVAAVRTALTTGFPSPIEVVTSRPLTGEYVMIVYGGDAGDSSSRYGAAVNELDCDDSELSDVAWIRDYNDPVPTTAVVNATLGAIGFGLGLTATNDNRDCMCAWANGCQKDQSQVCVFKEGIARDPGTANGGTATQICTGAAATQDEHSTVRAAFCE